MAWLPFQKVLYKTSFITIGKNNLNDYHQKIIKSLSLKGTHRQITPRSGLIKQTSVLEQGQHIVRKWSQAKNEGITTVSKLP